MFSIIRVELSNRSTMDEIVDLEENGAEGGSHIKSWETYKILHRLRETVHQKRSLARQR